MIDLHAHLLPDLDDGPADLEDSLELARAAVEAGIETMVATPHIRSDHPFDRDLIPERTAAVREALQVRSIPLKVLVAGEVAVSSLADLDDDALRELTFGDGPYLLVESPYTPATLAFDKTLEALPERGFTPVLAHPERSPAFRERHERVRTLVEAGGLVSITAGSLAGRFGRPVYEEAVSLLGEALVHNIASDCHDTRRRPPGMAEAAAHACGDLPTLDEHLGWLTRDAPAAILEGSHPGEPPAIERTERRGLLGRFRRT